VKVLMLGGAGHVGGFITPYLLRHHQLRVLDLRPPQHDGVEWVEGGVTDPDALRAALTGVDAFIWLVMRKPQGGTVRDQDIPTILENYEINTKALHLTLFHYRMREYFWQEETTPYDTPTVYGLSKGFGEQICQYFARWWEMNLIALRITGPRTRAQYLDERANPRIPEIGKPLFVTDEEDLANAYLAALRTLEAGHRRFDAFFIAGDEAEQEHNLSKAKRVLGWTPRSHLLLAPDASLPPKPDTQNPTPAEP
jgi:nucleoside-diphosphate-sugar epimerase